VEYIPPTSLTPLLFLSASLTASTLNYIPLAKKHLVLPHPGTICVPRYLSDFLYLVIEDSTQGPRQPSPQGSNPVILLHVIHSASFPHSLKVTFPCTWFSVCLSLEVSWTFKSRSQSSSQPCLSKTCDTNYKLGVSQTTLRFNNSLERLIELTKKLLYSWSYLLQGKDTN
jgi:hypothetical protein